MPLARVDLPQGRSTASHGRFGEFIQIAMREVLDDPKTECFQIISRRSPTTLRINRIYLRVDCCVEGIIVQIFLEIGCSREEKARRYEALTSSLHNGLGPREADVVFSWR